MANKKSGIGSWIIPIIFALFIIGSLSGNEEKPQNNVTEEINSSVAKEQPLFSEEEIWIIKKWAERKDPDAMYLLAYAFDNADHMNTGTESKEYLAAHLYEEAAKAGHADAQYSLSAYYRLGDVVPENPIKAFELNKKAAEQNHIQALFILAMDYESGKIVPQNRKMTFEIEKRAAEAGYEMGYRLIATKYRNGSGTEKNNVLAYKWHKLSKLAGGPGGWPTGFRDLSFDELLAEEMSAEEIQQAESLVNSWLEKYPTPKGMNHMDHVKKSLEKVILKNNNSR